tara:strand:+ start:513 stop:734 length:222 start_codon:yes stop_codon:yes gene_type:complete
MKQIDKDTISFEWTTDDVKEQLKSRGQESKLTTDDCRYVLNMMLDKHDATIGVNWDVMDVCIDRVFELKESKQ